MSIEIETRLCTATMHGAYGKWEIGVEYAVGDNGVYHLVRRPVNPLDHSPVATEWRVREHNSTEFIPVAAPTSPPLLNLPDEGHGYKWGDPIYIHSDTDDRECPTCHARPGVACNGSDGWPEPAYHDARRRGFLRPVRRGP